MQNIEQEVKDIWYHLRGNGEVGLLEQTRRNTETLQELKDDLSYVKQSIREIKEARLVQGAELKGMRRAFNIALILLSVVGAGGSAYVVRILTDIVGALQ